MDEERKTSLEKMVATELLKLTMETDEERKARLKKMVATTQLRVAPEVLPLIKLTRTIHFLRTIHDIIGRAKRAPHWACSIEISRDIYYVGINMCMSV